MHTVYGTELWTLLQTIWKPCWTIMFIFTLQKGFQFLLHQEHQHHECLPVTCLDIALKSDKSGNGLHAGCISWMMVYKEAKMVDLNLHRQYVILLCIYYYILFLTLLGFVSWVKVRSEAVTEAHIGISTAQSTRERVRGIDGVLAQDKLFVFPLCFSIFNWELYLPERSGLDILRLTTENGKSRCIQVAPYFGKHQNHGLHPSRRCDI